VTQTVAITGASATTATILANRVVPALLDRYLARTGYDSQQTGGRESDHRPANLWQPVDEPRGDDHGAHGEFADKAHARSAQMLVSHHRLAATAAGAATAAAGLALATRARRR
jgi:hypothetical protein